MVRPPTVVMNYGDPHTAGEGWGVCKSPLGKDGKQLRMAPWEVKQAKLKAVQQRTCNPKKYFGIANDLCPAAFMAHFPCDAGGYH